MMMHERCDLYEMILVKGSELHTQSTLFITTTFDKEELVAEDLMNLLIPYDQNIIVTPYRRRGIVVVTSQAPELDLRRLYSLVLNFRPRHIASVVPILRIARALYEEIKKSLYEIILLTPIKKPFKFVILCRKRGFSIDSCSKVKRFVGSFLEDLGLVDVDFKNYEYFVRIEILDDRAYISPLMKRSG